MAYWLKNLGADFNLIQFQSLSFTQTLHLKLTFAKDNREGTHTSSTWPLMKDEIMWSSYEIVKSCDHHLFLERVSIVILGSARTESSAASSYILYFSGFWIWKYAWSKQKSKYQYSWATNRDVHQVLHRPQNKERPMQNNFEAPVWQLKMVFECSIAWCDLGLGRATVHCQRNPQEIKIFKKQGNFVRPFFRGEVL